MKKTITFIILSLIAVSIFSSCGKSNKIPCPSYWSSEDGDTRGTPLKEGEDGKMAPEGANVRKSNNGLVKKKKSKKMNANYYRGKGKENSNN